MKNCRCNFSGWGARIRTSIAGTRIQSPAIGRHPNCVLINNIFRIKTQDRIVFFQWKTIKSEQLDPFEPLLAAELHFGYIAGVNKMKSRWNLVSPYLAKYKNWLIWGLLFVILQKAIDQVSPWMVKILIDNLNQGLGFKSVYMPLSVILAATIISASFLYYERWWVIRISRKIEYEFRSDLYQKFQAQPKAFTDAHSVGGLMSNATNDLDRIRDFLGPVFLHLTGMLGLTVFTLVSIFLLDPRLALLGVFPVLTLPLFVNFFLKRMHKLYSKIQENLSSLNSFVQDTISGVHVVKAYGKKEAFSKKFEIASENLKNTSIRVAFFTTGLWPLIGIFGSLGILLVIAVGGYMVIKGMITLGALSAALIYLLKLQFPLAGLGWVANLLQRSNASLDRIIELEKKFREFAPPKVKKAAEINNIPEENKNGLYIKDLSFKYQNEDILKNINLHVPKGSSLGIVGPTGSGKTSLIHVICGIYPPPDNSLFWEGRAFETHELQSWKKYFSLAPQDGFLFSTSIRENILLGQSSKSTYSVDEASELSGLSKDLPQIPQGLEALLGERGINLSGGQRQRVGLARSLITNSDVLCLDDTLSALDSETENFVLNNLKTKYESNTLIVISHRYSTIMHCDQIIFLEDGQIVEQGNHQQLLDLGGKYAQVYHKQILSMKLENA